MMNTQLLSKTLCAALFAASMLFGSSVFAQVKIGTNPTTIDPANNLEVEASTTGRKVSIDKTTGKMTIADGSQANESVLTSDANGVATWKPKSSIRVEETVFIGEQSGTYLLTTFNGTFNHVKDRIPFVPRAGSLTGYDATTKLYTIQESGYYRVFAGGQAYGSLPSQYHTEWRMYIHPFGVLESYANVSTGTTPVKSLFFQGYLTAGTEVGLWNMSFGDNQTLVISRSFLSITKMF
jgi:hypothetical protein